MESNNSLHHHEFQDHDHGVVVDGSSCISPSSLATFPNLSAANHDNDHAWKLAPTFLLNNNNIHATCDSSSPNSFNNSMIQDLRFSLPNEHHQIHNHNQHLISNQIKEESSTSSDQSNNSSFQSFSDMLSPSTTPSDQMLLFNTTISPSYKNLMFQPPITMQFQDNNTNNNNLGGLSIGMTSFSQIFPSINISKLNSSTIMEDSSDFRGDLDRFGRERFMGGGELINQAPNSNLLELFKGGSQYGIDHSLEASNNDLKLSNSSNNLSSFNNNGVLEQKRSSCIVEPKSTTLQNPIKKQRFEARSSCPPFKIRKEKLGDRIAALQQLVAPFGKTDTASVLMEAIGYIKFLQNQVETLSVPYMKLGSSRSNNLQRISNEDSDNEENKQDLRSRGLCLVPLTCVSYITSDFEMNGGAWPPHHYNPGF